jgi:hypothetical protein
MRNNHAQPGLLLHRNTRQTEHRHNPASVKEKIEDTNKKQSRFSSNK